MNEAFVISLAIALVLLYAWAFRNLPDERWQVIACIPSVKLAGTLWRGINLTYYGLITATAQVAAILILLSLAGAAGIPLQGVLVLVAGLMLICMPASNILARIIEKKKHTLTVGGAFFAGLITLPAIIWAVNHTIGPNRGFTIPVLPTLAAAMIAYAFGEGLGRLACISFGCCYGKPLDESGPFIKKIFNRFHFVFNGATKKIAYASKLEGRPVIPVQGLSAIVNTAVGLVGMELFLTGQFRTAFLMAALTSQAWRIYSETLRCDYRGEGKISAYQWLGIIGIGYAVAICFMLSADSMALAIDLGKGLGSLWNPALILALQALWVIVFIRSGKSSVTGSTVTLCVHKDRI